VYPPDIDSSNYYYRASAAELRIEKLYPTRKTTLL
jgi:hypothetical protein